MASSVFGIFNFISFIFIKNKKYKTGSSIAIIIWFVLLVGLIFYFIYDSALIFRLYFEFFKIGFFSLGGGLATIPFLKELGNSTAWFSDIDLANMIAVSESTPGAIGVNMSTYVGYQTIFNAFDENISSTIGINFSKKEMILSKNDKIILKLVDTT